MPKPSANRRTTLKIILPAIFAFAIFALAESAEAAMYYVDAVNGNDSWTGTSGAYQSGSTGPWKTVGKVNSFNFQPGDDVYFKEGGIYEIPASPTIGLNVDWSGTSSDRAVVGSYYVNSSGASVVGYQTAKPKITGVGRSRPSGSPANYFMGVRVFGQYVTVQDLEITEVNGNGLWAEARDGFTPHNILVQRLNIHHNNYNAMAIINLQNPIVQYCDMWENVEGDILDGGDWGAAFSSRGNSNFLFYRNRVWRNWGEGIGFFSKNTGSKIIENISYDNRRPNIYYDCNSNGVIARNLVYRTQNTITTSPFYGNIIITAEDWHGTGYCDGYLDDVSVWGNLISGGSQNLYVGSPYIINRARVFNNTIVEPRETPAGSTANVTFTNVSASEFKNNIILQSAGNTAPIANFPPTGVTKSNNIWSHASASIDADARGTGDKYSVWPIQKTTGWAYTGITTNSLTGAEFSLPAGSAAIDAGVNLCPNGCASGFEYNTLLNAAQSNLTVPTWINTTQSGAWDAGAAPFATAIIPDTPPAVPSGLSIR